MNFLTNNFATIVFYAFSALIVFSALRVITSRNPVHAVLFLVLAFISSAGIWLLREGFWRWLPFGAALAGLMALEMIWVLGSQENLKGADAAVKHAVDYSNTKELGRLLYTDYVYPFEIAAVILLVAMVAAIALTLRRRKDAKSQVVSDQIAVKKADRLRIVTMKSVRKD
jgi:NADH-quinone oxidoreductase subunit J